MRAHLFAGALVALAVFVVPAGAEPVEVTDDSGAVLTLSAPARRVVALAPHLTELLYAAGGAARVVGVDSYSRYPATVATLPRVGDAAGLDLERILALRPELAFGWLSGNKGSDLACLRQLGVPLFLSEPRHLADIPRTLRIIGQLLGTSATAEQQARAFEAKLQALQAHAAGGRTVSVFFEVWHQPLSSVNGEHLISDLLPNYRIETMALPLGALPHPSKLAVHGTWHGQSYRFAGVFLSGAEPASSPFSTRWDPAQIPRILPNPRWRGARDFTWGMWLDDLERNPGLRYVSDGDPETISFPRAKETDLAAQYRDRAGPY